MDFSKRGSLYISLHAGSPRWTGKQTTCETTYKGYKRAVVPRDPTSWLVEQDREGLFVYNLSEIVFPECVAEPRQREVITHFGIGVLKRGDGHLIYIGTVDNPYVVTHGLTFSFQPKDIEIHVH